MLKKNNLLIFISNKNYYISYLKDNKILFTINNLNKHLKFFLNLNIKKNKLIINFLLRFFHIKLNSLK